MADRVEATVEGTVSRVGSAASGPFFVVEVLRSKYPDRVTCWGVAGVEGERVTVRGQLSWRKTTRGEKTYVDVSLNDCEVLERSELGEFTPPDGWAEVSDDGAPF